MNEATPVIFRTYRRTGVVTAFFPTLPADFYGNFVVMYTRVGQHGAAHQFDIMARDMRASTEAEYTPLLEELRRVGYANLAIVKRPTAAMHLQRKEAAPVATLGH